MLQEAISLILFIIPGFLVYFWVNLFGLTPSSKQSNGEISIISALLWVPVMIIVLVIYNVLVIIAKLKNVQGIITVSEQWVYINHFSDLVTLSESIWFILFYVLSSMIVSYLFAKLISGKLYGEIMERVNKVRKNNNIAPLSMHTTVWNSTFLNNVGQIVEYKKSGEKESIKGILLRVPRASENNRAIVLEAAEHWSNVMEYYDVEIEQTYIDVDSGITINIYNLERALEAQEMFVKRFPDGITS